MKTTRSKVKILLPLPFKEIQCAGITEFTSLHLSNGEASFSNDEKYGINIFYTFDQF